jgi:hypothetical protein
MLLLLLSPSCISHKHAATIDCAEQTNVNVFFGAHLWCVILAEACVQSHFLVVQPSLLEALLTHRLKLAEQTTSLGREHTAWHSTAGRQCRCSQVNTQPGTY